MTHSNIIMVIVTDFYVTLFNINKRAVKVYYGYNFYLNSACLFVHSIKCCIKCVVLNVKIIIFLK